MKIPGHQSGLNPIRPIHREPGEEPCLAVRSPAFFVFFFLVFLVTGCRHNPTQAQVPSAPPPAPPAAPPSPPEEASSPSPRPDTEEAKSHATRGSKPLAIETGLASWYGAPYHNRRGSNGEVYDMHAMTAAHRTLPLGSVVRVTNLKTGTSAIVRITDRGPFVKGRIIDLSLAAAQKVDVWRPGTAEVRVEVLESPHPLDQGGKWAVQIGPLADEGAAEHLQAHFSRRYPGTKVLTFSSPVGDWWVRVRVQADDRQRANEVASDTQTGQGSSFLVRLD